VNQKNQTDSRLATFIQRVGTEDVIKQREEELRMLTEQNLRLEIEATKRGKALQQQE
jgi:hypothetical protein